MSYEAFIFELPSGLERIVRAMVLGAFFAYMMRIGWRGLLDKRVVGCKT